MVLITDGGIDTQAADQIFAEIEKTLREMKRLATLSVSDGLTEKQRESIQTRINELRKDIDGIAAMLIPPDVPIQ
jgi:flagellin-like hook-associated protein FlgL